MRAVVVADPPPREPPGDLNVGWRDDSEATAGAGRHSPPHHPRPDEPSAVSTTLRPPPLASRWCAHPTQPLVWAGAGMLLVFLAATSRRTSAPAVHQLS